MSEHPVIFGGNRLSVFLEEFSGLCLTRPDGTTEEVVLGWGELDLGIVAFPQPAEHACSLCGLTIPADEPHACNLHFSNEDQYREWKAQR